MIKITQENQTLYFYHRKPYFFKIESWLMEYRFSNNDHDPISLYSRGKGKKVVY